MRLSIRQAASVCLLGASIVGFATGAVAEINATFASFGGRWSGMGTIVPATGPSEDFKCVVTYFPNEDGSRVKQNLRCRGENHKFEVAALLQIRGGEITGSWQENTYALTGLLSGSATTEGFVVVLSGQFFQGKMTVVSSQCEQSVTLVPVRTDQMKELAARLRKC